MENGVKTMMKFAILLFRIDINYRVLTNSYDFYHAQ